MSGCRFSDKKKVELKVSKIQLNLIDRNSKLFFPLLCDDFFEITSDGKMYIHKGIKNKENPMNTVEYSEATEIRTQNPVMSITENAMVDVKGNIYLYSSEDDFKLEGNVQHAMTAYAYKTGIFVIDNSGNVFFKSRNDITLFNTQFKKSENSFIQLNLVEKAEKIIYTNDEVFILNKNGTVLSENKWFDTNEFSEEVSPAKIKDICTGLYGLVVLDSDGNIYYEGKYQHLLGISKDDKMIKVPIDTKVKAIVGRGSQLYALLDNNDVMVWGKISYHDFGKADTEKDFTQRIHLFDSAELIENDRFLIIREKDKIYKVFVDAICS